MGQATVEIGAANFQQSVEKPGILLLDWWASWCGPCRAFAPIYEEAASKHPDVVFGKINTEVEQQLAGAFEIRSIPTLMIFRDGVLLFSQPGMLPGEALEELVGKVKALDMAKVKAEIAEQEKAAGHDHSHAGHDHDHDHDHGAPGHAHGGDPRGGGA